MNLWVIFLTGLTTGGLTCLAVQGGLLATTLAKQRAVVPELHSKTKRAKRKAKQQAVTLTGIELARNPWPIVYFLVAKLIAYTVLGFFLGALGSVVQLSPTVQAVMQIGAGLFMLATALNMLNVHPIFRYAVIQPPKALTRLVRNQSKSQEVFAPALLGLMTVFIPCGTTQAMEVLAISSADALLGALIMFVFVLGTSPTFFVLGFLATRIRGKFQKSFLVAAAGLILILGVVSLDGGLNLLGLPIAPSHLIETMLQPGGNSGASALPVMAKVVDGVQEITINALNTSYFPNRLTAQSGQPIRLKLVTKESYSCTRSFTIPRLGIRKVLPLTGEVVIDLPAQPKGSIFFTCGMGMYSGTITVV
ncbi:MAG: sulfite exporter TauE/SafE family protein [Anaerolineae bacterium]|nr:sulfite exporter TauE/SafE family protein [Anaerolineae bacterium]